MKMIKVHVYILAVYYIVAPDKQISSVLRLCCEIRQLYLELRLSESYALSAVQCAMCIIDDTCLVPVRVMFGFFNL